MKPILECQGLSKRYSSSFYALNNLNLALEKDRLSVFLDQTEAERQL